MQLYDAPMIYLSLISVDFLALVEQETSFNMFVTILTVFCFFVFFAFLF